VVGEAEVAVPGRAAGVGQLGERVGAVAVHAVAVHEAAEVLALHQSGQPPGGRAGDFVQAFAQLRWNPRQAQRRVQRRFVGARHRLGAPPKPQLVEAQTLLRGALREQLPVPRGAGGSDPRVTQPVGAHAVEVG